MKKQWKDIIKRVVIEKIPLLGVNGLLVRLVGLLLYLKCHKTEKLFVLRTSREYVGKAFSVLPEGDVVVELKECFQFLRIKKINKSCNI